MNVRDVVPYACVYLDASFGDLLQAAQEAVCGCADRESIVKKLQKLWTDDSNPNHVLPTLSVRSALDLFLQAKNYPPGSEIIVSAINIPDMIRVLHHHKLKVVSMDVDLENMRPKLQLMESLVSGKTVAMMVACIFAKTFDLEPFFEAAKHYSLDLIHDCAEGFLGFKDKGHPGIDLTLFSFGAIKFYTSFGGAIAKVKDEKIFKEMDRMQRSYPVQARRAYLYKLIKYSFVYICLNCPSIMKPGMAFMRTIGFDYKSWVVSLLRGFPKGLMQNIRAQPSTALLTVMLQRQLSFDPHQMALVKTKGDYVSKRLPKDVTQIGQAAEPGSSYWLFPVVVENPDEVLKALNALGIDAYRGATQLNVVEPDNGNNHLHHLHTFVTRYPHEAKFLIDHVVYLPINRTVPYHELDKICAAMDVVMRKDEGEGVLRTRDLREDLKNLLKHMKLQSKL